MGDIAIKICWNGDLINCKVSGAAFVGSLHPIQLQSQRPVRHLAP